MSPAKGWIITRLWCIRRSSTPIRSWVRFRTPRQGRDVRGPAFCRWVTRSGLGGVRHSSPIWRWHRRVHGLLGWRGLLLLLLLHRHAHLLQVFTARFVIFSSGPLPSQDSAERLFHLLDADAEATATAAEEHEKDDQADGCTAAEGRRVIDRITGHETLRILENRVFKSA